MIRVPTLSTHRSPAPVPGTVEATRAPSKAEPRREAAAGVQRGELRLADAGALAELLSLLERVRLRDAGAPAPEDDASVPLPWEVEGDLSHDPRADLPAGALLSVDA